MHTRELFSDPVWAAGMPPPVQCAPRESLWDCNTLRGRGWKPSTPCPFVRDPIISSSSGKGIDGCFVLVAGERLRGSVSTRAATRVTGNADGRSSRPHPASLPPHLKLHRWTVTHQDIQPRRIMTPTQAATTCMQMKGNTRSRHLPHTWAFI